MSGLDKIIEHIEQGATEKAAKMIENTKDEAARIVADGKAAADAKEAALRKQNELDVSAARSRNNSAAEMVQKRLILEAKQREVESIFETAKEELMNLEDEEYFGVILDMISKYALDLDGEIRFSEADLKRLPNGFEAKVYSVLKNGKKLTVSDTPARIDGGFILAYGDIEENCSFDALIEDSRENLQDKISQILFV